jgi:hypothetical protein
MESVISKDSPQAYSLSVGRRDFDMSDFKYIKDIKIDTQNIYIVTNKKQIVKEAISDNGLVNLKVLSETLGKRYYGVILYDIGQVKSVPMYRPYVQIPTKCIISIDFLFKRQPKQGNKERHWTYQEDCSKKNLFDCVNSNACTSKNIRNQCSIYNEYERLTLRHLNRVMKPYKLYIFSPYKIDLVNEHNHNNVSWKPHGLWFAVGDEWLQFMKKNGFWMNKYNYLYEIEVDMEKVYVIHNLSSLQSFSKTYAKHSKYVSDIEGVLTTTNIDWDKFTKDTKYSGIIIEPNFKKLYWKHLHKLHHIETFFKNIEWYVTWDVSSGSVWNSKCVKNLKLIYKKEDGVLVPVQRTINKEDAT